MARQRRKAEALAEREGGKEAEAGKPALGVSVCAWVRRL